MIVLYILLGMILFIFIILHFFIVADITYSNEKKYVKVKFLFYTIYPLKEKTNKKKPKKAKKKKIGYFKKKKLEKKLVKEKQAYDKALKKAYSHSNKEKAYKEFIPKTEKENTDYVKEIPLEENQESIHFDEKLNNTKKKVKKEKIPKKPKDEKKEKTIKNKLDELKEKWKKIKPYISLGKKALKKLIKAIRISDVKLSLAIAKEDAYECAIAYGKTNAVVFNALSIIKIFFDVTVKKINISCKFNSSKTYYDFKCKVKIRPSTIIAIVVSISINYLYTIIMKKKKIRKRNKI